MGSLSLAPGPSSDCVSLPASRGPAAAGMRLSESSNIAAPGRCAHHPGITPGGVICGDRDNSPMGRGVRVAGPRVPASTLISHRPGRRPGIILRGVFISPVRQAALPQQGPIGYNLRACRDGPLLDQAGLAEAGGSHHEYQRLASGLEPSEQGSTLHPGRGPGHGDQLALGPTCPLRSRRDCAAGRPGTPHSREQAPPDSPCRG